MPLQLSEVAVHLRAEDNVAVATHHLKEGTEIQVNGRLVRLCDRILFGHKFALEPIAEGDPIRKYGQTIGFAISKIEPGQHVHLHNVSCDAFERDYASGTEIPEPPVAEEERYFDGYLREDGRAGTRNYIAVVCSVNCSASVARRIVERVGSEMLREYPNVDGVIALTHQSGCAMDSSGRDRQVLKRTLAGFAQHPNVFDSVVLGLGCETNQASEVIEEHQLLGRPAARPRVITIQGSGGTQNAIEAGVRAVAKILPRANDARRTRLSADKIILGTECGGSDGNSGITANPAVGVCSDLLVAQGGTTILAETPEIFGAEHLLTRRAVSREVGEKLVERIKWWEWYASIFGAVLDNNPGHGNKEGGLTTIYEKSLGAVAKAGKSALVDVYDYAEQVTAKGMVVMDTPGFDPHSVTGMVAGGANVVLFTTGRGSVFGCKPTPSIKVASNTPLYRNMIGDMDFDAGVILTGTPVEVVGRQLFDLFLQVASGKRTKSEEQGIGEEEFIPWTIGPIL